MAAEVVWLDGALVPSREAVVSVFDHGLTVGNGVFETLKAVDGVPFAVRRHLERLRRSGAGLDLLVTWSDEELRAAVVAVLAAADLPLARVRITVTGGPAPLGSERGGAPATVVVAAGPLAPATPTTDVSRSPWPRNERGAVVGLKTTSYAENVRALAHAKAQGCSEALFANTAGALCEGTGSNVFVVVGGRLLTPSLASGCLAGVTRALVLETTDAEEAELPWAVLEEVTEAFLTSTTRDVQAVARLDGRVLDAPGPHTRAAAAAFARLAEATADP